MADEEKPRELTPEEKYAPKLPGQVQKQVDAVNAAITQLEAEEAEQQEEPEQEEGEEYQGEEVDQNDDQNDGQPGFQQPPEDTWEQRAKSTAGRLQQSLDANSQMAKRLSDLERELNLMRVNGAQAPQPPQPKPVQKLIKPEELSDYGDEFFDVVGRRAREELTPVVETLAERVARLESGQQSVGKIVEQSQKRGLYDTLRDEVPEWSEINHHPAFHNWLAAPDPYSGRQRKEMLNDAFSRHDADRVVNFFREFLTEATGSPPNASSQNGQSAPPPANGSASGRPSLEDFAAPGRARSAPQQLPPDKPVYSHAWIAKFMADKRTGKYRGREAEAEATERDIFQAQHEGRIQ